jgi:hypothetical protein
MNIISTNSKFYVCLDDCLKLGDKPMSFLTEQRLAAILLLLSCLIFLVAGSLFTVRVIWALPIGQSVNFLRWERGMVVAAFLVSLLGFGLLENILRSVGDIGIARIALLLYIISTALVASAEMSGLANRSVFPQLVLHIVLAYLGQAAFGAALLHTGYLPTWIGWIAIIWTIGCLIIVPIVLPNDIYFPWLFYVVPLIIGIGLLRVSPSS